MPVPMCIAAARELSRRNDLHRFRSFHSRATCFLARSQKRRANRGRSTPLVPSLEGPSNHLTDHSSRRGSRTSHTLRVNVSRNWHRLPVIVPHPAYSLLLSLSLTVRPRVIPARTYLHVAGGIGEHVLVARGPDY